MKIKKTVIKIYRFFIKHYFIVVFLFCIGFVGFVSVYKLFFTKPLYIYARVRVGQGLWWASTQRPPLWLIKSINKGDVETDLTGQPTVEILSVNYYPTNIINQYDVYLDVRLKVSGNKKNKSFSFNRSSLGVGTAVDFEFPSAQFSGTIIDLSITPIKKNAKFKTVYLAKAYAFDWEYDAIRIGDKFFDGENNVIEIIDKSGSESIDINPAFRGTFNPMFTQIRKDVVIKVKILVNQIDNKLVFGNDQVLSVGKDIDLSTDKFSFINYTIAGIE